MRAEGCYLCTQRLGLGTTKSVIFLHCYGGEFAIGEFLWRYKISLEMENVFTCAESKLWQIPELLIAFKCCWCSLKVLWLVSNWDSFSVPPSSPFPPWTNQLSFLQNWALLSLQMRCLNLTLFFSWYAYSLFFPPFFYFPLSFLRMNYQDNLTCSTCCFFFFFACLSLNALFFSFTLRKVVVAVFSPFSDCISIFNSIICSLLTVHLFVTP